MNKRSVISLLLAVLLVFGLAGGVFAADYPQNTFSDVKPGDWYNDAVNFAQATELMKGVGNNRFDPNGAVTRAMVVTVLYRMADQPDVSDKANPFSDVSNAESNWYLNAVKWAVAAGVTKGASATTFAPEKPISREQMAAMIMRFSFADSGDASVLDQMNAFDPDGKLALSLLTGELDASQFSSDLPAAAAFHGFQDAKTISSYARWNVLFCALMGIMKGDTSGNFRPQATLTRAECAQTFLNYLSLGD